MSLRKALKKKECKLRAHLHQDQTWKSLIVVLHFASSSDSLPLPQPNLICCCSCSSVYSLTSLLFPFVLSSNLIHICHWDYMHWIDIRDQLWDGYEVCQAVEQYLRILWFIFCWLDYSRCFIIFIHRWYSSNRSANHNLTSAWGCMSFNAEKKKHTLNAGLVIFETAAPKDFYVQKCNSKKEKQNYMHTIIEPQKHAIYLYYFYTICPFIEGNCCFIYCIIVHKKHRYA